MGEERSLQQVEMRFRDTDLGHSAILCSRVKRLTPQEGQRTRGFIDSVARPQTEASIPRITASRSPGNLASSSVRRNVTSFRCPS